MSEPVNNAIPTEIDRGWYFLDETMGCYRGSYKTREIALKEAREYCQDKQKPIHLVECYTPATRISDCVSKHSIDNLIAAAEEEATHLSRDDIEDFYDADESLFGCSEEQKADLLALVRQAFDEWQVKNAIVVKADCDCIETKSGATVFPDGTIVENDVCNTIADGIAVEVEAGNE